MKTSSPASASRTNITVAAGRTGTSIARVAFIAVDRSAGTGLLASGSMARTAAKASAQDAGAVLDHIATGTQLIVPLANGEPTAVLDAIEAATDTLEGVGVHQMHAIHDRPYMNGQQRERLRHV